MTFELHSGDSLHVAHVVGDDRGDSVVNLQRERTHGRVVFSTAATSPLDAGHSAALHHFSFFLLRENQIFLELACFLH